MHISDFHKSPQDSYESLFRPLVDDCNTYSANSINKPDIVVVSGDIIKGGSPDEIATQYSEVKEFLENIVAYFLERKKERIVIVPGNHDIDWNISKASMQRTDDTQENVEMFYKGIGNIRWSRKDFSFYKISNTDLYKKRIENFSTFYLK
jgi:3',5'-cyclic AMP phosphodiesterase CpdA